MIRRCFVRNHAQGLLAYATILATCVAGLFHASIWAFVAGACVLALISISNHRVVYSSRLSDSGGGTLLLSSTINAVVTSASAVVFGRIVGWAWGV